jgi:hypothetical protein
MKKGHWWTRADPTTYHTRLGPTQNPPTSSQPTIHIRTVRDCAPLSSPYHFNSGTYYGA